MTKKLRCLCVLKFCQLFQVIEHFLLILQNFCRQEAPALMCSQRHYAFRTLCQQKCAHDKIPKSSSFIIFDYFVRISDITKPFHNRRGKVL